MKIEEKIEIANKLQQYDYIFRAFWDLGVVEFVDDDHDVKTAAICFDDAGVEMQMIINKTFWENIGEHAQLFLICHECLHVLLQHGKRFLEYLNTVKFKSVNIAADVVINHMLVDSFHFDRDQLKTEGLMTDDAPGCWIDTVFPDQKVRYNQSTEYYLAHIKDDSHETLDFHIILDENELEDLYDLVNASGITDHITSDFIEKLGDSVEAQESLNSPAGVGIGNWNTYKVKATRKKKWETVITKWENRVKKSDYVMKSRWERTSPRYSELFSQNGNIMLPSDNFIISEYFKPDKIDVFFFLDTSGSCISLAPRFFKAAKSLDKKRFNVHLFSFDTVVKEVDIKTGRVHGGGGTSFHIIESKIQQVLKRDKKSYSKIAVFCITDGYGDHVNPEKPEKWHWFLTNGSSKSYIPRQSKTYQLKDYE